MANKNLSVGTKIGFGFAVTLVMLLLVGLISRDTSTRLMSTAGWVSHTHEVLETISRLASRMRDSEASVRGFVITGDPEILKPHNESRQDLPKLLAQLRELVSDNPSQARRLQLLEAVLMRKTALHERQIELLRSEGMSGVARLIREDGTTAMAQIRTLAEEMESSERDLLRRRQQETDQAAHSASTLIWLSVSIAIALAAFVGWLIARDISRQVAEREALLKGAREAIQHLGSATAELLAATAQQGSGAQEQAAAIAQTATTAEEIAQTAGQSAERSQTVAAVSQQAVESAVTGKRAADEIVRRISELKERVSSMAQSIIMLSQHAQSIGELNAVVGEIAEQSNILALNAAIEASRAGEHGRGFSVVAEEVRALAEQSKKATRSVRQLLGDMQRETNRAVIITEEGTKSADNAVRVANDNGSVFGDLQRTVGEAAQAALQVAASASQQAVGVTQIQQAMRDINQVTSQSLASTRQIESASQDLNQLSTRLRDMVGSGE